MSGPRTEGSLHPRSTLHARALNDATDARAQVALGQTQKGLQPIVDHARTWIRAKYILGLQDCGEFVKMLCDFCGIRNELPWKINW